MNKKWVIFSLVLLPIVVNFIFTIMGFMNFGDFHNNFTKNIANFIFYLANWPSILVGMYSHVFSTDGEIVYDLLGWLTPSVLAINSLAYGLIGLIVAKISYKAK